MKAPFSVYIVDPFDLVRAGVRSLLHEAGIRVVGEASSCRQALPAIELCRPDLLLLDPGCSEPSAALDPFLTEYPRLPVLILSASSEQEAVLRALRAGASGYLTKAAGIEDLLEAARSVVNGGSYIDPRLAQCMLDSLRQPDPGGIQGRLRLLTSREREVLVLAGRGFSNNDIAATLQISVSTVKSHFMSIYGKIQVESRTQAVLFAAKHNLDA